MWSELNSNESCTDAGFDLLSESDLALIHALQIAPRISWARLAPILGSHPSTLAARWDRLTSNGLAWSTANEIGGAHGACLGFIEVDYELAKRDQVVATLSAIPGILSIDLSTRNRDLLLLGSAPTAHEFSRGLLTAIAEVDGITHHQTSFCTRVYQTADSWRLGALDGRQQREIRRVQPPPKQTTAAFHPTAQLLIALARNGRATAADIAKATGVHPTTAQRQLNRAMSLPSLRWRCDVAQAAAGSSITCHWFARLAPNLHADAAAALAGLPELRMCASTTGSTNFLMTMWLPRMEAVFEMENRIVELLPSIQLVESSVAVQIIKRVGWMLTPDGRATGEVVLPPRD